MLSLADTTGLLDQTTTGLQGKSAPLTPQEGIAMVNSWIAPLQQGENTRPLAEQLMGLKIILETQPVDQRSARSALSLLAETLSTMAMDMGGEGEMPALLEALATALRQVAETSRADTAES